MTNLRNEIDSLDKKIVELLSERRKLSEKVVEEKDTNQAQVRDIAREEEILRDRIKDGRTQGLDAHYVTRVFHEIIEDSLRLQHNYLQQKLHGAAIIPTKVAFHGINGSYCTLATKQHFGNTADNITFVGFPTFAEVVQAVEAGRADYAMLPVENTTSGGINDIYDLLLNAKVFIVGEEIFKISHCLLGIEGANIQNIKRICTSTLSHADCKNFVSSLGNVVIENISDSAVAAKKVADDKDPAQAAIASDEAARLYGLQVLRRDITNQKDNYIRYILVGRTPQKVDQRVPCKTSIVMSVHNRAGALVDALQALSQHGIDFKKLESRPVAGNPWEELFYLDFEGNITNPDIDNAIKELTKSTKFIRVLGSYPSKWLTRTTIASKPAAIAATESITLNETPQAEAPKADKPKKKKSYQLGSRDHKPEDTIIEVKGVKIGGSGFVVMAGPCSVESYDQITMCARHAKENGAVILRGGCFKPRTSPYNFQGLGYEGLDMLVEAGRMYGLPVITEVMSEEDVDGVAAKSDMLQVGARNMQNFTLLKSLGRTNLPILLKRGMSSSVEDLLNAAEYILANGNQQVILCERGIRTFETATRSTLDISAVPVLRRETHLPIIVDPSHAAGERDLVPPLAMAAKAVGAHGIIVEFHPEPEKALSDGPQALRFPQFSRMMNDLLG